MEQRTQRLEQGYSLIELMMALVISVIVAGIAIPTTANALADIKLRGSANSFASLVQQARLTAVQRNATYIVRFGLPSGHGAYVDLNGDGNYTSGEPMVQFGGEADHASAPTGSNPPKLDGASSTLGWTGTSGNVSFNPRGLPCSSSASPCGTNVNYVFYFNDTRTFGNKGWSAVSITAGGSTKVWFWTGSKWID